MLTNTLKTVQDDADIDIRALLMMFWRRRMIFIATLLMGLSLAVIGVSFVTPSYTAKALLLIDADPSSLSPQDLIRQAGPIKLDSTLTINEVEVLRSRSLARKAVERLDLMRDPELNPHFRALIQAGSEGGRKNDKFKSLSIYEDELERLPPEFVQKEMDYVVSGFLDRLSVKAIPGSYALQIKYISADPAQAARVANGIAEVYIEQRLESKFQATQKLTNWLDKRLTQLREQVRTAEAAATAYKAKHNLVTGARAVVSAEQLSQLNSQMVLAKAHLAEAQAHMEQVVYIHNDREALESSSEVINSDMMQSLKLQKIALEGEISELKKRYGPRHPEMVKRYAELSEIESTIGYELENIRRTIEGDVQLAHARVRALQEGVEEITGQRNVDNEAMIKLRELEREVESGYLIMDTFLETYKRSDAQEQLQEANAQIISYAVKPREPSFPNKPLILLLSTAIFMFFGLTISLLLEKLDNTYKNSAQLEAATGFPCYALIPHVRNMTQQALAKYILSSPSSTVAESVRTLRTVLSLRARKSGKTPKVVTLTSSFSGEGKSTLSVWLARLSAKSGEKTLLIDADLRRPTVHRTLARKAESGLVDYLTGQKELDQVITKDPETGLHVIYGQSVPNSALDLVSSQKMKQLIESLRDVYSMIIIDSPACLAVSDARVLATLSDQTLYVVGWDDTPRDVVVTGVKQFTDMHYQDIAFVLSNVNIKQHVKDGHGDKTYYYTQAPQVAV